MFEEAESSHKTLIKGLEEEVERLQVCPALLADQLPIDFVEQRSMQDKALQYQKVYETLTGTIHKLGQESAQAQGRSSLLRDGNSSWLHRLRNEHTMVSGGPQAYS